MTDRTEALREEIARAWCASGGFDPDEMMPNDGPRWKYYLEGADAILPIITLEAEVARKDEALRRLAYWFETDEDYLAGLSEAECADNSRMLSIARAALEARNV